MQQLASVGQRINGGLHLGGRRATEGVKKSRHTQIIGFAEPLVERDAPTARLSQCDKHTMRGEDRVIEPLQVVAGQRLALTLEDRGKVSSSWFSSRSALASAVTVGAAWAPTVRVGAAGWTSV